MFFKDTQNRLIKLENGKFTHFGEPYTPSSLTAVTPTCTQLGYKVGQYFKVLDGCALTFKSGTIVKLVKDDKSARPLFVSLDRGEFAFVHLSDVAPLTEEEVYILKEKDKIREDFTKRLKTLLRVVAPEAVIKLPDNLFGGIYAELKNVDLLDQAFTWANTKEGRAYWKCIDDKIGIHLGKISILRDKLDKAIKSLGLTVDLPEFDLDVEMDEESPASAILWHVFVWDDHGGHEFWGEIAGKLAEAEQASQKINMHDTYQTKSGEPVRILCIDRDIEAYPVVALLNEKTLISYTAEGLFCSGKTGLHDLVKVKFKEGEQVEVSDDGKEWCVRTYHKFFDDRHFAYVKSAKPASMSWSYVRKIGSGKA